MKPRILVIDDEESIRFTFKVFLRDDGYEVVTAGSYKSALEEISRGTPDVIVSDIFLGDREGTDLLREVEEAGLICPVIMVTGEPLLRTAMESVRLGAFDYMVKPVEKDKLLWVVKMALQHKALIQEKERYRIRMEAIFESVGETIVTLDSRMRVMESNRSLERLCGICPQEIMGRPFAEAAAGCRGACLPALAQALKSELPVAGVRIECGRKSRPGQVVALNSSPLIESNKEVKGLVLALRDETRLNILERELQERHGFQGIIGKSPAMQKIYTLLEDLAETETTVLITGESGTGKEMAVNALHAQSSRARRALIKVNCAALSENLLESELFGHVKGAFTGAVKDKIGRFQAAHGGTIFLDEIGEMSPRNQLRLLRVLQEKEFEPVGSSTPVRVDLRVVSATNTDLEERVRQGEFREDLYYRLKVVDLKLPPLRERGADIRLLACYFLQKNVRVFKKEIKDFSEEVMDLFMTHPWPGNIRQLEHAVEHAFVVCRGSTVTMGDLPSEFRETRRRAKTRPKTISGIGEEDLIKALDRTGWNKAKAARMLGVSRPTLYRKIGEYALREPKMAM